MRVGLRARNPVLPGIIYHEGSFFTVSLFLYFATVDVVLSLGMDTVLLPGTIPMAIVDTNRAGQYQCICFHEWQKANKCFSGSECASHDVVVPPEGNECSDLGYPPNHCILRYK